MRNLKNNQNLSLSIFLKKIWVGKLKLYFSFVVIFSFLYLSAQIMQPFFISRLIAKEDSRYFIQIFWAIGFTIVAKFVLNICENFLLQEVRKNSKRILQKSILQKDIPTLKKMDVAWTENHINLVTHSTRTLISHCTVQFVQVIIFLILIVIIVSSLHGILALMFLFFLLPPLLLVSFFLKKVSAKIIDCVKCSAYISSQFSDLFSNIVPARFSNLLAKELARIHRFLDQERLLFLKAQASIDVANFLQSIVVTFPFIFLIYYVVSYEQSGDRLSQIVYIYMLGLIAYKQLSNFANNLSFALETIHKGTSKNPALDKLQLFNYNTIILEDHYD